MVFPLPVGLPLSVYDNVAYAPRMGGVHRRGELDAIVEDALRQAALWDEVKDRLDLLGTRLSGGQQQRLTIARALSHRPDILCLNRFSIAVDPLTTMKIEDVLLDLKARMTIVVVSGQVQQARRLADRVAFMNAGRVVETGDTDTSASVSYGGSSGWSSSAPNPLPISIYENVVFGLRVHSAVRGVARRRLDQIVETALTDVLLWDDVKDDLGKRATLLTLEQQQKLCIARLLPLTPRVILMDEPCSALDASATEAVEHLMQELKTRFTIVIVTHNMGQARRVATIVSSCYWENSWSRAPRSMSFSGRASKRPSCMSRDGMDRGGSREEI